MVRIRGLSCALATDRHVLRGESAYITNPKHVDFVRKRKIDFRPEDPVCAECAKDLAIIYDIKVKRAQELKKQQRDTLTISSSSSLDDYDRLVYRTPKNKQLLEIVKQNAPYKLRETSQEIRNDAEKENQDFNITRIPPTPSTPSMAISNDSSILTSTSLILEEPSAYVEISTSHINISTNSSLDLGPSTSAAAAADKARKKQNTAIVDTVHKTTEEWRKPTEPVKRKRVHFEENTPERSSLSSTNSPVPQSRQTIPQLLVVANVQGHNDDNEDDMPSPNALNGTRMPHVQPIPRRRQFQHAVPTALDIYMQGITGG
ncbi:uncharacterized protein [Eurosta solidaginis]|uniref:uncharacterized protein n=1 Tax=Eurosta solidaginis TaxID=178769 RepID=UPI003530B797